MNASRKETRTGSTKTSIPVAMSASSKWSRPSGWKGWQLLETYWLKIRTSLEYDLIAGLKSVTALLIRFVPVGAS